MFSQEFIMGIVNGLVAFATDLLLPLMLCAFFVGAFFRVLVYYTVKREEWFARAFQKRVYDYLDSESHVEDRSFYVTVKMLIEKTYYELFIMRSIMKRRNPDVILDIGDRLFLVQQGSARLVKDTLKQVKYFRYDMHRPKMIEVSKHIYQNNPCFNRALGIFPVGVFNDILNIMPGIFIVGGIFGTFLGIMKALPELGGMDLADIEGTKEIMDLFLLKMSFSMSTSIIGIVLSVLMTIINTFFSPGKLFIDVVERFENSLDVLWNRCSNNKLPNDIPNFNEHRDPIEALAEDAVNKELEKSKSYMKEKIEFEERQKSDNKVELPKSPNEEELSEDKKAS